MYWARPLAVAATTTTKAVGEEQPNPLSRPCETEHKVGSTKGGLVGGAQSPELYQKNQKRLGLFEELSPSWPQLRVAQLSP